MTFTPGPWNASSQGIETDDQRLMQDWYRVVNVWPQQDVEPGDAVDDINLIAAAPRLYQSCRALLGLIQNRIPLPYETSVESKIIDEAIDVLAHVERK
jgi:hypothetical protein